MKKAMIVVDVYGNFACFTNPNLKLDRLTYDVITPSAARGILNAIYSKPIEFYYEIAKIEVMKNIQYIDIKKNELKNGKIGTNCDSIFRQDDVTQKSNRYLKDVYYRIYANIVLQPSWNGNVERIVDQFNRRVECGKCFYQPFLGVKECVAYFEPPNPVMRPISLSRDFGISVYDVFDIRNTKPLTKKNKDEVLNFTFYRVVMENGVIKVPPYDVVCGGGINV